MGKYRQSADKIDVSYVAHLARLELTGEEIARFQGQLDDILDYVKQLGELDVEQVEPTAHAMPVVNVFRKDEVRPSLPTERVMANAPSQRANQFLVPKIVE